MTSIFNSVDIPYDKEFVTKSLIFIQQNVIVDFEKKKKSLLNKLSKIRNSKGSEKSKQDLIKIYTNKLIEITEKNNKINELKWKVFFMMKKILVKNINNYQKLCRNSNLGSNFNDNDEIESECFIIFENCIYKFISDDGRNDFYFYFNKSLSRSLYKIFLNNIKDLDNIGNASSFIEENIIENKLSSSEVESVDFYLSNFDLDENCLRVIHSKLVGERPKEFLENNFDFTQKLYDACLKKIKKELANEFCINFNLLSFKLEKAKENFDKEEDFDNFDEVDFFNKKINEIENYYEL